MDIHLYIHHVDENPKLDQILTVLKTIQQQEKILVTDLATLTAQVQANTEIEASAITLIKGIAAQLAAAKSDPVAIQALADQLHASAANLAAAISANTPDAS